MRVVVASKFWYLRGGLERVMFDEVSLLERAGHDVAHFSTAHPNNVSSPWSQYFVPYLEIGVTSRLSAPQKACAVARMFHNGVASASFRALVSLFKPDVIHIHGIHRQISPSVLDVARKLRIPVVQTVHDYHHVCPADVLLLGDGRVCEPRRCGVFWYGPAIGNRCVRGSAVASAISAAETAYQRVMRAYERSVDCFICPSAFTADVMRRGGWRNVRTVVVPNAVACCETASSEDYFLYVGRLVREKGIETFLEASASAGVRAVVAGTGPLEEPLRERFPEVEFCGWLPSEDVASLMRRAMALVVPSEWYENAPMSVLESMAAGVPVIASRIGGIPEQVRDGIDGVLFDPGDVLALRTAIQHMAEEKELRAEMGQAARARAENEFSLEAHGERLLAVYEEALAPK